MKKNYAYFVALASLAIATSCSEEELQSGGAISNNSIAVHPTIGKVDTRATETTTANLASFKTFSFLTGDDKNYMDGVTYNGNGGEWTSQDGTFYWPVTGDLNFYSYAPAQPGSEGTVSITPSAQKLTGFVPYGTAATQQDFIYSKAKGNLADNGSTGVDLNFDHALSEITIQAQNSNTAYTVDVSGVKVGNVISKGDFTFPSLAGGDATWSLGTEKSDYTTEWENATALTSIYSSLDASNTAFMLLPQQLVAETKAVDGNYIALKVKITMQGGQVIHDGWAYVAVPTLWEMGKHYNYTVDFSSGAGQDEDGNDIISGTDVVLKVNVTPWDEENKTIPSYIYGHNINSSSFYIELDKYTKITPNSDGTWKQNITSVNLKSMQYMFNNNKSLASVNLSELSTSNVTTMGRMFQNCESLEILDLSGWNTSKVTDMTNMFSGCSSLTSLDLSNFNTKNVTDMGSIFYGCWDLSKLNISNWNTSNVTNMYCLFCGCRSLTTIDLSKWITSNVTTMKGMFSGCSSLTSLDLSKFNTSKVTNMGSMFSTCKQLTTLDVSSFDTKNVKDMEIMFAGCSSLTSLDLSNFDTQNVFTFERMFNGCSSLNSLDISSFNTSNINTFWCMFSGCSSLTSLDLSKFNTSKVTNMGSMFRNCSALLSLDLSGWNMNNVTKTKYMFDGCKVLKNIYMVGCDEATINKIKSALTEAGLSTDIIKTSK